jgi:CheY-like chemotaxis protein
MERNLLLVDDEPAYHSIVKALLTRRGVTVDSVYDAPAAFCAIRSCRYDLILMDIEMAGINGYRGAAHIRHASDAMKGVPIIAFTTGRPATGERHFIDRGFDGWLQKPFCATDLLNLLGRWLDEDADPADTERAENSLSRLLGDDQAHQIMDRFRDSLIEAVSAIDAGADPRPYGHSIGGLASMLGLPALGEAWLVLENGRTAAWPTVRNLTLETIMTSGQPHRPHIG